MIKFDQAFETVMAAARRLGTERVDFERALGRILAEDVASDIDVPPFDKSAMDGYACRRADLKDELEVIEMIPAGYFPQKKVNPGQCAKIMTGSAVPQGADCVIMKEYIERTTEHTIRFVGSGTADNICIRGEDVKKGDVVLRAGCRLSPQQVAVLASVGCTRPLVAIQPKVGIIATGDELVEPGGKPAAGQIRNSNAYQLAAQLESITAAATKYGIAADTKEALDSIIGRATAQNDVVLVSGGVSVGEYDLVKGILEENGFELLFEKVAVKPGRPMVFGVSDTAFCFGLPGNPVSTFVTFELLVKPFLYRMMGHDFKPPTSFAPLAKTITRKKTERDSWLPVVFTDDGRVEKIEYHGSAHINALCQADGLICVPAGVAEIKKGASVAVRQI